MRRAVLSIVVLLAACGTGSGRLGGGGGGGGATPEPWHVILSEVMYHPLLEEGYDTDPEPHEWLEIANIGEGPAQLEGWTLSAGVEFTFPAIELAAGDAVVVVADRDAFQQLHALPPERIAGVFAGRLSNAGEKLEISDAAGEVVDVVEYSDSAPWPMGADALGVGSGWLRPSELPEEDHRYRGRSLQRVIVDGDGDHPGSWVASRLDGETPGAHAPSSRTVAVPFLDAATVDGLGDAPLPPNTPITIRVTPSRASIDDLRVEWFVEDLRTESEPTELASIERTDDGWAATLPGLPAETIVRWRVLGDGGDGDEVIHPRDGDPMQWMAAFVGDPLGGSSRAYRVYISPANLVRMSQNIAAGRVVDGCAPNPTWNDRVEAFFVWGSEVYDVRVRFQGSRFQRRNGPTIPWSEPAQLPVRSWRVAFPKYAPFDDRPVITLNKMIQSCPGIEARVGFQLYAEAGIPAARTRYARLFINGRYYNYALEIERPGAEMYQRWHDELEARDPTRPDEPGVGDLFKAVGCNCDEGPFGWGDERLLGEHCGYSVAERYAHTYDRKTWRDGGTGEPIQALIEGLHAARAGTDDELRAYLEANYDVDRILTHMAVTNWTGPWDDMLHNHFLYRRRSDGRWVTAPWDLDLTFGPQRGPRSSLYVGLEGVGGPWWNRTKDSFLRVYTPEYEAKLLELNNSILTPANVLGKLDEVLAAVDPAEVAATPSGPACDWTGREAVFRDFVEGRHAFVNEQLAP